MLEIDNLTVRFGGLTAVDEVGLALERGEIVSVIGPNGSGKTTLFNGITGFVRSTAGSVSLDGQAITATAPYRRVHMGLARTFQTPRVEMETTVAEAVLCGYFPQLRSGMLRSLVHSPRVAREERELRVRSRELLARFELEANSGMPLGELPMGLVRIVDVARAMAMAPSYLLLDEPAAGLTRDEQEILVREVRRLAADGVGVLLVEHNFELVKDVSERVLVLNEGQVIARGRPAEVATHPKVLDAYLGVGADDPVTEATTA